MNNPHLRQLILGVVENQLRENDPPETQHTLKRLMAKGYSRQKAVEMIGAAVVEEIWTVLQGQKFDRVRYKALLDDLE